MDGQAENAPGTETLDSLADFLDQTDNPTEGTEDEEKDQAAQSETDTGESEEADGAPDQPDDEESAEQPEDQTSDRKHKLTVKGEDGADEVIEVDDAELKNGYMRQRDYSRKTLALAERERQAVNVVVQRINESRQHFVQEAQLAHAAVLHLAGLKSPEEMQELAANDQPAWVREQQREKVVRGVLAGLRERMQQQGQQAQAEAQKVLQQSIAETVSKLQSHGIDVPKLQQVYQTVGAKYGFQPHEFNGIHDARLVLLMRDAAAYQALKDKKPVLQPKAQPKLPAAKQPVPRNERANRELNKRFQGGRAKVNDLADFLHVNGI